MTNGTLVGTHETVTPQVQTRHAHIARVPTQATCMFAFLHVLMVHVCLAALLAMGALMRSFTFACV